MDRQDFNRLMRSKSLLILGLKHEDEESIAKPLCIHPSAPRPHQEGEGDQEGKIRRDPGPGARVVAICCSRRKSRTACSPRVPPTQKEIALEIRIPKSPPF
jgi:hypothetical protein